MSRTRSAWRRRWFGIAGGLLAATLVLLLALPTLSLFVTATPREIVAAIYLDGGFDAAQEVVRRLWWPLVERDASPPKDAKTVLQEWAQGKGLPLPLYVVTDRAGPPHAPVFQVELTVQGFAAVTASGSSKRMAERAAAEMMLMKVRPADGS